MKVTKAWIKKWGPCSEAVDWFNNQPLRDSVEIINYFIEHAKESDDYLDWALWSIPRFLGRKGRIAIAIYSAGLVLSNFEEKFPNDNRPREAIEAAKKVQESNTKKNRDAAESARSAAKLKITKHGLKLMKKGGVS